MPADDGFGMPFRWIVRAREIDGALAMAGSAYRSRIFDPHTTIWAWMAQTISQDRSCRHAVAQVVAHHAVRDRQVSARTGAYVQARQRLDIEVIQYLARSLGRRLEDQNAYPTPLDRPLIACDGTTVSSPDSPSIVKRYPKMRADYGADGLGFPTIRVLYLTSLATGAVMDMQIAPYRGKGTHEIPLLKRSLVNLREGDVIVGDRAYCARLLFSYLPQHGFDLVTRMLSSMRLENLRVISVHGKRDHVYRMRRPAPQHMPPWMTAIDARRTPSSFDCRVTAVGATIRNQKRLIELATTLTDPKVSKRTIEDIYRLRWDVETDIRSLKVDLGARILRCQSAEMIEKELWDDRPRPQWRAWSHG